MRRKARFPYFTSIWSDPLITATASRQCLLALLTVQLAVCLSLVPASAQETWDAKAETLVIFNPDFPGSEALAQHYANARGIPEQRLLALPCSNADDISRTDFNTQIRDPLRRQFDQHQWWQRGDNKKLSSAFTTAIQSSQIRIITLIRGVPIRITREASSPTAGKEDEASVDSELTLLGMEPYSLPGFIPNPFFKSPLGFHKFTEAPGLFLVSRLDGPDDTTVLRMIDDASATEKTGLTGRAVIDLARKDGPYEQGEEWLRRCALLYRKQGIPVYVDRASDVIPQHWPLPDTALYFGWYRDRVSGVFEDPSFRFSQGAVVCHLHSFSAAHLRNPTQHWSGPLLLRGAAATLGNVWEPYLPLTCHLNLFNELLLAGATLAEAAWFASPSLSWMQVVLGDPLYRPFKKPPGSRLGAEGNARDYAIYHGLVTRYPDEADAPSLKKQLLQAAEKRQSPHLIELLGLLSGQTGLALQSAELFDHAASLYPPASPDHDRARLYQAEAFRTHQDFKAAKEVLQTLPNHRATQPLLEKLK
jgi:uncharacterized protein (TIGR03790 family)